MMVHLVQHVINPARIAQGQLQLTAYLVRPGPVWLVVPVLQDASQLVQQGINATSALLLVSS